MKKKKKKLTTNNTLFGKVINQKLGKIKSFPNKQKLRTFIIAKVALGFPGGSEVKASAWNAGDLGSIPGLEDPLEKEMATHSSILAWRIPWREEPGGL